MTVLQKKHRQNGYSKFKNFKKKKGKADLGRDKLQPAGSHLP